MNSYRYTYMGSFMPEDADELISIVRTKDRIFYEYWNELFAEWRILKPDSFGERQLHIHDTMLKENWARVVFPNAFI